MKWYGSVEVMKATHCFVCYVTRIGACARHRRDQTRPAGQQHTVVHHITIVHIMSHMKVCSLSVANKRTVVSNE